jgi:tRNA(Leu) C34 or U34 (ribose-2'-O)-methylase TrmL
MAVKILGSWEIGYHAPVTEQYYWSLAIRDFGVSDWNMIPKSGIRNLEHQVNLTEWNNYDEFFEENKDLTRVFIEPRTAHQTPNTTWLHEFEHPENCVYVFGSAHYNPTIKHAREQDYIVSIKTKHDKGVLWADQCVAIVLYEREKQWQ